MVRTFDPVQLNSIELFCKAAELGSFTAAAEALGLTPASVSRSIKRLEERLGVRLFSRTTRSVRLTNGGALYRQECHRAREQIAEAERAITGIYPQNRHLSARVRAFVDFMLAELKDSNTPGTLNQGGRTMVVHTPASFIMPPDTGG